MTHLPEASYYPIEKGPNDEVHLLVQEENQPKDQSDESSKKKCPAFRIIRKLFLFSISTYALYYLACLSSELFKGYNETGEYVSQVLGSGGKACNPKVPYSINQTYEFSPKEFSSLNVFVFGNSKYSTVKFEQHDSDKIVFEPEIYISSIPVADSIHIGIKTKDSSYSFGIKGPSWFKGHDKCIKADIIVKIPKSLKSFEKIWVRLPYGNIATEAIEKITLQKLHLELGSGDIIVKNFKADQLELTSGIGKIELFDSISEFVGLYSRGGNITAKNVQASRLKSGTANGDIDITVKDSVLAYAKNFNGNSKIIVESLAPEFSSTREGYHFSAGTVNGHSSLFLPGSSYKGRFGSRTLNGEAQFYSRGAKVHMTKDYKIAKVGYTGEDPKSPSYAEAASFNGSPFLELY